MNTKEKEVTLLNLGNGSKLVKLSGPRYLIKTGNVYRGVDKKYDSIEVLDTVKQDEKK